MNVRRLSSRRSFSYQSLVLYPIFLPHTMAEILPSDAPLQKVTLQSISEWNDMAKAAKREGENNHQYFTTTGHRLREEDMDNPTQYTFDMSPNSEPFEDIPLDRFIITVCPSQDLMTDRCLPKISLRLRRAQKEGLALFLIFLNARLPSPFL